MSSLQWPWHPRSRPFPITWSSPADPVTNATWISDVPSKGRREAIKRQTKLLVQQTGAECEFLESAHILSSIHTSTTNEGGFARLEAVAHITVSLKHAGYPVAFTAHIYLGRHEWVSPQEANLSALSRSAVTVVSRRDGRYPNHVLHQNWSGWATWTPGMSMSSFHGPSQDPKGKGPAGGGAGAGTMGSITGKGGMPLHPSSGLSGGGTMDSYSAIRKHASGSKHDDHSRSKTSEHKKTRQHQSASVRDISDKISRLQISGEPRRKLNPAKPPRSHRNESTDQASSRTHRDHRPTPSASLARKDKERQPDHDSHGKPRKSHWWS